MRHTVLSIYTSLVQKVPSSSGMILNCAERLSIRESLMISARTRTVHHPLH